MFSPGHTNLLLTSQLHPVCKNTVNDVCGDTALIPRINPVLGHKFLVICLAKVSVRIGVKIRCLS